MREREIKLAELRQLPKDDSEEQKKKRKWWSLRRFARRNRVGLIAAAFVVVLLIVGMRTQRSSAHVPPCHSLTTLRVSSASLQRSQRRDPHQRAASTSGRCGCSILRCCSPLCASLCGCCCCTLSGACGERRSITTSLASVTSFACFSSVSVVRAIPDLGLAS